MIREGDGRLTHFEQLCNACGERFDSRTKLFTHVRETGHASAEPGTAKQKAVQGQGQGQGGKKNNRKAKR